MPYFEPCKNNCICGSFAVVGDPTKLCERCKQEARQLDRAIVEQYRIEQQNQVPKNEPRHRRWWQK